MSQNTRCPSCATLFKVVADQLRISDGWVRCGQCQQIFDATAYLQESPQPQLLPDLGLQQPLDSGHAPPEVADADTSGPVRGWDTPPKEASADGFPVFSEGPPVVSVVPALEVPDPVVPGFLMAPVSTQAAAPVPRPMAADQLVLAQEAQEVPEVPEEPAGRVGPESRQTAPLVPEVLLPEPLWPEPVIAPAPAGYELPSVDLPEADFEWGAEYDTLEPAPDPETVLDSTPDFSAPFEEAPSDFLVPLKDDAADLPWRFSPTVPFREAQSEPAPVPEALFIPLAQPTQSTQPIAPAPPVPASPEASADAKEAPVAGPLHAPDWAANLVLAPDPQRIDPVLHPFASTEPEPEPEPEPEADVPPALPLSDSPLEPSFVRTARRQAFWRQWEVRLVLALLSLLLVVALVLQVLVQQRNHLAAAQPQWRSFLQTLCVPLQCKVGPYRHISSIVIDSSSFNKVQGDAYQFAIALKNTSGNVLEIPAIELTLTDAQDQAVLRRVFTRKDLSAPRTLAAHGDWSANLQVQLTFDGAPIAGYRVLAFYP